MRMRVNFSRRMNVPVRMDEIGLLEQSSFTQNFPGRACSDHAPALENEAMIGNVLHDIEVVRRRDHSLRAAPETNQEIDDLARTLGVESGSGLVKQQHFRIQHQHGGKRDVLLLSR